MRRIIILATLTVACAISLSYAVSWHSTIENWHIDRQSITVGMIFEGSYNGEVSPVNVTTSGRSLGGYHSKFADINLNDVRLEQRLSAEKGFIGAADRTVLVSEAVNTVTQNWDKTNQSPIVIFDYSEQWPVRILSRNAVNYEGLGINDRDFSGNNRDYMGISSLYNKKFLKDRLCVLHLNRTNITVTVINQTPQSLNAGHIPEENTNSRANAGYVTNAEYLFTKNISYKIDLHSTGITEFNYRQTSSDGVATQAEGYGRFYGDYDLKAKMYMGSVNEMLVSNESWPDSCCQYTSGPNCLNASQVFDCYEIKRYN